MEFYDPKLRGLAILLDDFSGAINWLSEQAIGHHQAPVLRDYDVGHIRQIADHIDATFGTWVINTVISGTIIDRGADFVFAAASRNPRLAPIMPLKPFVKDLAKLGFSIGYRGKSFGDAVTDRGLSKLTGLYLHGWMPEVKTLAGATVAHSLRSHHFG
jgi:hypothetical protein